MLIKVNIFQIMYLVIGVYNTKTEPEFCIRLMLVFSGVLYAHTYIRVILCFRSEKFSMISYAGRWVTHYSLCSKIRIEFYTTNCSWVKEDQCLAICNGMQQ